MEACPKCDGEMDIHYGLWCPMCDKPETRSLKAIDFFRAAKYIAAHEGYPWSISDPKWYRKVLENVDFPGNDCFVTYYVDAGEIYR